VGDPARDKSTLRLDHAALIINECQVGMVDANGATNAPLAEQIAARGVLAAIARLAASCRVAGVPVVHSTIVPRTDYGGFVASCLLLGSLKKRGVIVEGNPAAEIHPDLKPEEGDFLLRRLHGLTPFHGTELEAILRGLGVDTVIVTGVSTNVGIPGICLEAVNRGMRAVVPEDCTAGAWTEAHEFQVQHTLPLLATVTTSQHIQTELTRSHDHG
jgi:nicotinamidase-related amidase